METKKTPMELLKEFAPELLAGIAVAAALGSDTCVKMWVKQARDAGITTPEIVEAIMVARYMKQAVVNDTVANTLGLISENKL